MSKRFGRNQKHKLQAELHRAKMDAACAIKRSQTSASSLIKISEKYSRLAGMIAELVNENSILLPPELSDIKYVPIGEDGYPRWVRWIKPTYTFQRLTRESWPIDSEITEKMLQVLATKIEVLGETVHVQITAGGRPLAAMAVSLDALLLLPKHIRRNWVMDYLGRTLIAALDDNKNLRGIL